MNDLAETVRELDGFTGYEDDSEGQDEQQTGGLIVGTKIKFNEAQVWVEANNDKKLPHGLELVVVKVLRVVQKWKDQKPIKEETRILAPGEKWPNLEALNAKCPQSEWREVFGKLQGPYQGQRLVYMVDPRTMAPYTWPSPKDTVGSRLCVNDIVNRTNWKRKFSGEQVYPVVEPADTFMPTGYGGRQRPHFIVIRWMTFGADGKVREEIESSVQQALDDFASNKQPNAQTSATNTKPTAKEITRDEILF